MVRNKASSKCALICMVAMSLKPLLALFWLITLQLSEAISLCRRYSKITVKIWIDQIFIRFLLNKKWYRKV